MRPSFPLITREPCQPQSEPAVLVTSPSADDFIPRGVSWSARVDAEQRPEATTFEAVYGVGGGRVLDWAKVLAAEAGAELVLIPTVLSTDAFATNVAAFRRKGTVGYVDTGFADAVFLDLDRLALVPDSLHRCALGDLLAILSAVRDWKETGAAEPQRHLATLALAVAEQVIKNQDSLKQGGKPMITLLADLLITKVQLGLTLGSPVMEEGTEHFFAYMLEHALSGRWLHGQLVLAGVVAASVLQHWTDEEKTELLDFLDLLEMRSPLSRVADVAKSILWEFPSYCRRHGFNNACVARQTVDVDVDVIEEVHSRLSYKS